MFIASYGLVTACYNKTLGEVYNDKECSDLVKKIINIIYEISEKENINLNKNTIEEAYEKANNFPFETKTSFQRDFEKKEKPDERELFGMAIIELGKKNNVNVQVVEKLYNKLNSLKSF